MSYLCVSPQQAMELIRGGTATIIDIRDATSFSAGHIAGARHVDGSTIGALLELAPAAEPLIVCCYHGISSKSAAEYLASKGFSQVYSVDGGYEAWRAAFPQ